MIVGEKNPGNSSLRSINILCPVQPNSDRWRNNEFLCPLWMKTWLSWRSYSVPRSWLAICAQWISMHTCRPCHWKHVTLRRALGRLPCQPRLRLKPQNSTFFLTIQFVALLFNLQNFFAQRALFFCTFFVDGRPFLVSFFSDGHHIFLCVNWSDEIISDAVSRRSKSFSLPLIFRIFSLRPPLFSV